MLIIDCDKKITIINNNLQEQDKLLSATCYLEDGSVYEYFEQQKTGRSEVVDDFSKLRLDGVRDALFAQ